MRARSFAIYNSGDTYAPEETQGILNGKKLPKLYNYDHLSPRANCLQFIGSNVPIMLRRRGYQCLYPARVEQSPHRMTVN